MEFGWLARRIAALVRSAIRDEAGERTAGYQASREDCTSLRGFVVRRAMIGK
ncbi:MAG: hypothetical protein O6837_13930 [Deltaproteobacteria bacterium]|nr:hypothetical protein [Deltaproteobacteria bacterium]MCZ6549195.1 hypothetical protein [Deltaproteobacteria bacterium]MCZ6561653.1 hypothetical protein [Deltaproteobacteria bacterium]